MYKFHLWNYLRNCTIHFGKRAFVQIYEMLYCTNEQREVDCFKYLWSQVAADSGCETDVVHRLNEGYRAWGELRSVLSNRGLGINEINYSFLHKRGIIVPTALYRTEAWAVRSAGRRKVNVFEKKFLRRIVGVSRMYSVRNKGVRRRAGMESV